MTVTHADSLPAAGPDMLSGEVRALLRLALPVALIAFVNMGMSVTDTVMVLALFGAEALAAVAVGSDLQSILFYLCAGVLGGIAPFYTAAVTRADAAGRRRLERTGWLLAGVLAAGAVPLVWTAPDWLRLCGLDPGLLEQGRGYTRSMALLLAPMLGVALYRTILTAAEKPKVFLKITLAMLPLNAVANYVLMMGAGPVPALGPTGAGVSSLLVALASFALLAVTARHAMPVRPAAGRDAGQEPGAADRPGTAAVLRVGIPIGITMTAETGIFLGATLYAATLGAAEVAAHTLTLRMAGIVYAGSAALLQAAMVRMARAVALEEPGTARAALAGSLGLAVTGGVALLLLLGAGAQPLAAAFFGGSAAGMAAAQIAAGLLVLLGLIQFAGYPGLAASGLLRGCRDSRTPMICMLIGYWGVGAPLGLFLCGMRGFGVTGLWIGLAAGAGATAILTLLRLAQQRHR
ncbi:MATE family efflux transporter [Ferrovibrio sp.]|uniref:MATE family efflux transporter n=1 Tax=Ferrovibrio sp. TaxID=1917215 RepID=UPI003511D2AA